MKKEIRFGGEIVVAESAFGEETMYLPDCYCNHYTIRADPTMRGFVGALAESLLDHFTFRLIEGPHAMMDYRMLPNTDLRVFTLSPTFDIPWHRMEDPLHHLQKETVWVLADYGNQTYNVMLTGEKPMRTFHTMVDRAIEAYAHDT